MGRLVDPRWRSLRFINIQLGRRLNRLPLLDQNSLDFTRLQNRVVDPESAGHVRLLGLFDLLQTFDQEVNDMRLL